ncbi:MAG: Asp-tRNA(Asn)/Glu-tRNA(Gln) amidotransferase subunit GatC [Candidatus Omnitrophota bacterium]|nr:MAG: Asp-tRNA(Asn)/Glu-tRNA(Gln) amidotransferase subunit GatC [Candidatus Omnitrophota bacterium]
MIDRKTVEHVALLARIQIGEDQKDYLGTQLSKILEYIDKLKKLDVKKVEPMRGLHVDQNVFRKDQPCQCLDTDRILNNAPSKKENYFKVPKVIE